MKGAHCNWQLMGKEKSKGCEGLGNFTEREIILFLQTDPCFYKKPEHVIGLGIGRER